jgi:tripartite-type tricarboxylate transporter receptor subunit TctC
MYSIHIVQNPYCSACGGSMKSMMFRSCRRTLCSPEGGARMRTLSAPMTWLAACALVATPALAQDFPSKPLRIVATEAGGGADFVARAVAQALSVGLGQPVVIDNRGATLTAIDVVTKSQPNGYTLFIGGVSVFIDPLLRTVPYDPLKDFSPITIVATSPGVLVVNSSLPAKSVSELIALAKARPGELNYGSAPSGSTTHLSAELFKSMTGINIVRVTYKGTGPLLNSLLGGEVQLSFPSAGAAAPHISAGRLRALAVTSAERSQLMPDLPTIAASGLPGYQITSVYDMLGPAHMPSAIVARLNSETLKVLNSPEIRDRFLKAGVESAPSTPAQLIATRKADMARLGKVIREAGIKAD